MGVYGRKNYVSLPLSMNSWPWLICYSGETADWNCSFSIVFSYFENMWYLQVLLFSRAVLFLRSIIISNRLTSPLGIKT